jgi:spore coat protein A
MKLSRKDFLRLGLAGGMGLFLPFGASGRGNNSAQGSAGALLHSTARLPEPFGVPLPVPPVLEPAHTDASADH